MLIKKLDISVKTSLNEGLGSNKPIIFSRTIYRIPTKEELEDVNSYNLNSEEILNGFRYTLVGRGILDNKIKQQIIESIEMLIKLFPDNIEYENALEEAKELKVRKIIY
jgi:hypothetical protein